MGIHKTPDILDERVRRFIKSQMEWDMRIDLAAQRFNDFYAIHCVVCGGLGTNKYSNGTKKTCHVCNGTGLKNPQKQS